MNGASIPAVYIGRFQPLHQGHLRSMLAALETYPHLHLLLGSNNLARSSKNPWTPQERWAMIRAALSAEGVALRRVSASALPDEYDALRWAAHVRRAAGPRAALIGFEKDASSAYLRWFAPYTFVPSPVTPGLSATTVRAAYFERRTLPPGLPAAVQQFLSEFARRPVYHRLHQEYLTVQRQQAAWDGQTRWEVRAFHLEAEQLWLERRRDVVGYGLWELPLLAQVKPLQGRRRLIADHPSRALGVPCALEVRSSPERLGKAVALQRALERPRAFFEDHHVLLRRMLGV